MSVFERFWTSYPVRITVHAIARLFPTWFHEKTWQCGEQEAVVRCELLEKAQSCSNARILTEVIRRTHDLILTLLNQRYGGLALEEHIPSPSVRSFSQLYIIMMALFCFRLGNRVNGLREDLATICREPHLVEGTWSILSEQGEDELVQARRIWDECLQVLGGDDVSQLGFFRGFFVVLANRTADDIGESVS
jgi:hypothetical protein